MDFVPSSTVEREGGGVVVVPGRTRQDDLTRESLLILPTSYVGLYYSTGVSGPSECVLSLLKREKNGYKGQGKKTVDSLQHQRGILLDENPF